GSGEAEERIISLD
nr:Chain B, Protein PIAS [Homo sapiens]6V7P_D Chain D, Protein PIAS [Homo sapiens]6V7R_B Chain B, Protein PIAS [Homo sapiens]6V7R_D Chain D, Protein PIAS [Homo sapiens]